MLGRAFQAFHCHHQVEDSDYSEQEDEMIVNEEGDDSSDSDSGIDYVED